MAPPAPLVFQPTRPDGTLKTEAEWEPWEQARVTETKAAYDAWVELYSPSHGEAAAKRGKQGSIGKRDEEDDEEEDDEEKSSQHRKRRT